MVAGSPDATLFARAANEVDLALSSGTLMSISARCASSIRGLGEVRGGVWL